MAEKLLPICDSAVILTSVSHMVDISRGEYAPLFSVYRIRSACGNGKIGSVNSLQYSLRTADTAETSCWFVKRKAFSSVMEILSISDPTGIATDRFAYLAQSRARAIG